MAKKKKTKAKQLDVLDTKIYPNIDITDELEKSYLDYAMSVIVSRALPDVRDGLKPVPVSYTHLTLPTTPYV